MDPGRRYHLTSGVQRRGPERPGRWPQMLGAAGRIGVLAAAASLVAVPLFFYLAPVPAHADAITLCLPGVGPVQQFSDDLSGELEEIVTIHELMHVQQCRTLGPAAWYVTYGSREGRMRLEAEAFCAEVTFLARRGVDPEEALKPRVEILHAGYGNDDVLSRDEVRALMRTTCRMDEPDRAVP